MESSEPLPGRFQKWETGAKGQKRAQEPVNHGLAQKMANRQERTGACCEHGRTLSWRAPAAAFRGTR